ncbi:MAG: hypothetical protein GX995_00055 [Clostridiales bacterium]|nr:hypothetical protein [Clostridiales bacterium]
MHLHFTQRLFGHKNIDPTSVPNKKNARISKENITTTIPDITPFPRGGQGLTGLVGFMVGSVGFVGSVGWVGSVG